MNYLPFEVPLLEPPEVAGLLGGLLALPPPDGTPGFALGAFGNPLDFAMIINLRIINDSGTSNGNSD